MFIRKTQIQTTIDRAVGRAEKSKDDYWQNELELQLSRQQAETILELSEKNAEIKTMERRIKKLEDEIKDSDRKYHSGRVMIKKAKYIAQSIHEIYGDILDQSHKQKQKFMALELEINEVEKLSIESSGVSE